MSKLFNDVLLSSLEEGLSTEDAIKRFRSHGMNEDQATDIFNAYDFPEINRRKTHERKWPIKYY